MAVSVIVAAFNEAAALGPCLDSLAAQQCDFPFEIIVVDDGSTDATAEVAAARPGVRVLRQSNAGPGVARNHGVLAAAGEYVAFVDADCQAEPRWLEALLTDLPRAGRPQPVAAIGGLQRGHPDDAPFARQVDAFLRGIGFVGDYVKPHPLARRVGHNASCNVLYVRRYFLEAGGFRPGLFPGEDVDLDRRLTRVGREIWFTPRAVVCHRRPDTPGGLSAMLAAYGRSQAEVVALHGIFRPIQVMPFLCVAGALAAAAGLAAATGPTCVLLGASLALPAVLARRCGLSFGRTLWFCVKIATRYVPAYCVALGRHVISPGRLGPKDLAALR